MLCNKLETKASMRKIPWQPWPNKSINDRNNRKNGPHCTPGRFKQQKHKNNRKCKIVSIRLSSHCHETVAVNRHPPGTYYGENHSNPAHNANGSVLFRYMRMHQIGKNKGKTNEYRTLNKTREKSKSRCIKNKKCHQ